MREPQRTASRTKRSDIQEKDDPKLMLEYILRNTYQIAKPRTGDIPVRSADDYSMPPYRQYAGQQRII